VRARGRALNRPPAMLALCSCAVMSTLCSDCTCQRGDAICAGCRQPVSVHLAATTSIAWMPTISEHVSRLVSFCTNPQWVLHLTPPRRRGLGAGLNLTAGCLGFVPCLRPSCTVCCSGMTSHEWLTSTPAFTTACALVYCCVFPPWPTAGLDSSHASSWLPERI
jgi:hypothetical protein